MKVIVIKHPLPSRRGRGTFVLMTRVQESLKSSKAMISDEKQESLNSSGAMNSDEGMISLLGR
ncbi:MAG: hypothetical protein A2W03_16400 [Candidatus Aminicenantes bacterium RBG_16_63_16]|nr:MAG: hypothetical protein A2W03_16400 [Candidatus Aminicenantes bacterium RBG_16_63_16]